MYTSSTSIPDANNPSQPNQQQDPEKCSLCGRKIKHIQFPCKCDLIFCSIHRLPHQHNCTFDYREEARQRIKKENPIVKGSKITKI